MVTRAILASRVAVPSSPTRPHLFMHSCEGMGTSHQLGIDPILLSFKFEELDEANDTVASRQHLPME